MTRLKSTLAFKQALSFALILSSSSLCLADENENRNLKLPGFFNDHMVVQQQVPIKVWGWAGAGETVRVSLDDATTAVEVTANEQGKWSAELPAQPASKTAHQLIVAGSNNRIKINDVLVGEVWLCSGQSNMEWPVQNCVNGAAEVAQADWPYIREINAERRPSNVPLDDLSAPWKVCSPATAGRFTACGYFMARRLYQELDIPVGLINCSWGGTRVEPWTPPSGFAQEPALAEIYQSVVGRTPGTPQYQQRLQQTVADTEAWLAKAKAAASGDSVEPSPTFPDSLKPFEKHQDPTMLYNGMIHALVGYPIRGAIWYQGESNHTEGMTYFEKKKALIKGWRGLWGQGDFPFYFVQLAPFRYGSEDHVLAELWEAQTAVLQLPHTGMVVTNDITTIKDIHPPNKQDVGARLANLALRNDYGKVNIVARSPRFDSMSVAGDELRVQFKNTGGGLKTRDKKPPSHFEIVGPQSNGFQPAAARIEGDTVILKAESVAAPQAFRFAWHKTAEPNLTGGTGLPVGAFRGGKVPDFMERIPDRADYTLVYELDLARLGRRFQYDVDNRKQIGDFDRIGYLLQLDSKRGQQSVFVSVDAFTDDVNKIGIPTAASKSDFQQSVSNMDVFSNVPGLPNARSLASGNIEFWPNNYGPHNANNVSGATNGKYDCGDQKSQPVNGYGSMQIHDHAAQQTVFAINHWNNGANADIGIGNRDGEHPDWTFSKNGGSYTKKHLKVFVRQKR